MTAHLVLLPCDIIILLMQSLSARDLAALRGTCRTLCSAVDDFGWKGYLWRNPRLSHSLSKSLQLWKPRTQVRYNAITDRNWSRLRFVARPLSQRWTGRLQPRLAINSSRLLLGCGNSIYSYGFRSSSEPSPPIRLEGTYTTSVLHPENDISAMICAPDGGNDQTIFVGYVNGKLEKIALPAPDHTPAHIGDSHRVAYDFHRDCSIEGLSSSGHHILSLSSNGTAALFQPDLDDIYPNVIDLETRGWTCHLRTDASTPYAVFGATAMTPLSVHLIRESSWSAEPSALLASPTSTNRPTAVYALSSAPPACAWGASDQIIVSGWFDGSVHVFDLRSPARKTMHSGFPVTSLLPTMSLSDPWSPEAIYSLSCGGGSASHVTAGSARHSVLAFWDVRAPYKGWSVHAPGNDSSPVYSVIMDGSRVFGANESRGFVYDFGPDVTESTYPTVPLEVAPHSRSSGRWRKSIEDGQRRAKAEGPGFYVTMYRHSK